MSDETPFIEVRGLTKSYRQGSVIALDGIDLTVHQGEILGLIGPNGAGKTTLLGCLLGLLKPDTGSVTIDGKPASFLSNRHITGYAPERPDFEGWMTGWQFLVYHYMLSRQPSAQTGLAVEAALSQVELPSKVWMRRLYTYSRGMLQRLNLAQMLIGKPRVLMLDEPTLGLDPTGLAVVRKIVGDFRDRSATAIINSHQLDEVERVCDRVAFIREGRIRAIENLSSRKLCEYALTVRWRPQNTAANHREESLVEKALQSGALFKECGRTWARFVVADSAQAAALIKALVEGGYEIEEAVPDRGRLEKLFEREEKVALE